MCMLNGLFKFILVKGAVAQLGERSVRNAEVVGSIPIGSTRLFKTKVN